jgi:hypothetical protein
MPTPIFDKELHKYTTPDGKPLDGVTSILGEYHKVKWGRSEFFVDTTGNTIDVETMQKAGEWGTAVHKSFELSLLYGIGSFDYPDMLENAVQQIAAFICDYQPTVVLCEQPLYSPRRLVAGTPDLFFTSPKIKRGKRICCLDAKTGVGKFTGPQTAIYTDLFREETGEKGLIDRFKLQLPKVGKNYKLEALTNKNDLKYFEYKLFCHNFATTL